MSTTVTLTTDFGLEDEYVAVMKGVILSRAPGVGITDVSHAIPPQDVNRAARVIDGASRYFPAGTIHVVVVDPGVGSGRRLLLVAARGQYFLAPDNGVLTLLLEEGGMPREVACPRLYLKPVSHTFHGRDILAPVAAALATGFDPAEVGPAVDLANVVRLDLGRPAVSADGAAIEGRVVRIDHFGNLITDIPRSLTERLSVVNGGDALVVTVAGRTVTGPATSYAAAPPGEAVALFGSHDTLEIAVNQGNASRMLGAAAGAPIGVTAGQNLHFTKQAKKN